MSSITLDGVYYDGRIPVGSAATMMLAGARIALIGKEVSERFDADNLKVSPRTGIASRFIALPGGAQFQCPDDPALERLPQEVPSESIVAWLERRWPVAMLSVALIAALVLWAYFFVLPAAAEQIAERIPFETEQALGDQALDWMDANRLFQHSKLPRETKERLVLRFDQLVSGLPASKQYRLGFRSAPGMGANAIALPGGTIVVTDGLVNLADSDDEIIAVLAHEIGHEEKRHAVRAVVQNSAVAALASALTADAASLGVAVAGLPTILTSLQFSRDFESEADEYAFAMLVRNDISPEHFATMMQKLADSMPDDQEEWMQQWSFLSSHPPSDERAARAHAAAQRFEKSRGGGK